MYFRNITIIETLPNKAKVTCPLSNKTKLSVAKLGKMPSCFLKDLRNGYCWACTLFESQTSGVAFSLNHFQGYHFPSTLTGQVSDQNTCLFCRALHQMPGSLNKIEGIPKSDWPRIQLLPSSCRKPVTTMVQEKVWCSKCITTMILSQPCIPYVHEYTTRLDSLTTEKN